MAGRYRIAAGSGTRVQSPCSLKHSWLWPLQAETHGCFCSDMPTCWARRFSWLHKSFTYRSYHTPEQFSFWKSLFSSWTVKWTDVVKDSRMAIHRSSLSLIEQGVFPWAPSAMTTMITNNDNMYQNKKSKHALSSPDFQRQVNLTPYVRDIFWNRMLLKTLFYSVASS